MSKINQSRIDKILSRREVSLVGKPTETDEVWEAVSQTDVSKSYYIQFDNTNEQAMYECECPSFKYDEDNTPPTCKHIEAIKQLKYRELTNTL
tara:strand:+ start:61 stop:339 length:279 start_codon:yes stop_codon:yes gene_type:complete